jgi:hypothetical protein
MGHQYDPIAATKPSARLGPRGKVVLVGFSAIAAYFLWTEHRAHVIEFLPWVFLALCPLMHLFMHRGHDHGGNRSDRPGDGAGGSPR